MVQGKIEKYRTSMLGTIAVILKGTDPCRDPRPGRR